MDKHASINSHEQLFLESVDAKQRETNIVITGMPDETQILQWAANDDDKIAKVWETITDSTVVRWPRPSPTLDRHGPILITIDYKKYIYFFFTFTPWFYCSCGRRPHVLLISLRVVFFRILFYHPLSFYFSIMISVTKLLVLSIPMLMISPYTFPHIFRDIEPFRKLKIHARIPQNA